ncbi:MAG: hypothetical protein Q9M37_09005 [Desulfonauticus sp.]|nr:hypothetical protein [Desulfonauticus sp.]
MQKLKQILAQKAKELCLKYKLEKVYFTQILGKRSHFLAGYGQESFVRPKKITLSDQLAVFIEGELTPAQNTSLKQELIPFAQKIKEGLL